MVHLLLGCADAFRSLLIIIMMYVEDVLFQMRLSAHVIPDLIRRHPELDSGQNEYTL